LVRQQANANNGDIVVALVDGEATVKRLVAAPGYFILKPDSTDTTHQPIVVDRTFRVQGKVRHVFKKGSELLKSLFDQ
jgi:repressor LexA